MQEERLRGRGTDSAESIEKRLKTAEQELEFGNMTIIHWYVVIGYDVIGNTPGVFDHMITNDTLDDAYEQLKKIFINVSDQQLFILIVISMATDITGDQISGISGQIMAYSSPYCRAI